MPRPTLYLIPTALLLSACGHDEPFSSGPNDATEPRQPGVPAKLTDNPGLDIHTSWLPDGSAILYTFETNPAQNSDQCLALLPKHGGARIREMCNTSVGHLDSTEVYGPSAVSDSGRLLYAYSQSKPGRPVPSHHQLRVATLADPQNFMVVHPLPFSIDGFKIDAVIDAYWLSEHRLVYLGGYGIPNTARDDTIVVTIDLQSPTSMSVVPGTISVASLAVGSDADAIVFTRWQDSRVYSLTLSSVDRTVLHDFAPGFPGNIDVQMPRLVTVVGRTLITVDLTTGLSDTVVGAPPAQGLASPAVSITGAVVAEGSEDLWLFEAPSP
jgi:hypothetical protein